MSEAIAGAQNALRFLTRELTRLDEDAPGTLAVWAPVLTMMERALDGEPVRTYGPREGHAAGWVVIEIGGKG